MGPWVFDAKEGARADATEALSSTDLTQAATKKVRPLFSAFFGWVSSPQNKPDWMLWGEKLG